MYILNNFLFTWNAILPIRPEAQRAILDNLQALSNNLKKIIFTNLKEGLGDKSIQEILNQQIDLRIIIMSHGYDKRNFLSGNFDIDAIKKIEKRYGFSLHIVNGQNGTYDPTIIKTIKQKNTALFLLI